MSKYNSFLKCFVEHKMVDVISSKSQTKVFRHFSQVQKNKISNMICVMKLKPEVLDMWMSNVPILQGHSFQVQTNEKIHLHWFPLNGNLVSLFSSLETFLLSNENDTRMITIIFIYVKFRILIQY